MTTLAETSFPNEVPEGHPYRLLFISCLLAVLYFLAYGFYGLSETDQGFIPAASYRILSGEIPYVDFLYVRPPLSLYVHACIQALLPASLEMIGERFLFYLFMALSVFWTTRGLMHFFDFRRIGISPELFIVMSYVCSVHNFPPSAWHTIDGILFASLGTFFLARSQRLSVHVLALFCFAAAALCKQAFYPMLVFGPALVFLQYGAKYAWKPLLIFVLLSTLFGMLWAILMPDMFQGFVDQTTGQTHISDFIDVAIIRYAKPFLLVVLPLLIVWRAHNVYAWRYLPAGIFGLTFWGLLGMHVYKILETQAYVPPSYGFSQTFWLIAVGLGIKSFWLNRAAFSFLLCCLSIGWCAGISWGYANTQLYFTPVLFAFIYGLNDELDLNVPRYFYGIATILLIWVFAFMYQYPYQDAPRDLLTEKLGLHQEKLSGIKSGKKVKSKLVELQGYFDQYEGDRMGVLPGYPMAHYLFDKQNPLPIDWAHNAEMDYSHQKESILHQLNQEVDVILLEREKEEAFSNEDRYGSLLSGYVQKHWTPVDTSTYFYLMKNPRK